MHTIFVKKNKKKPNKQKKKNKKKKKKRKNIVILKFSMKFQIKLKCESIMTMTF